MADLRMCPHCRAFVPASERVCTECNTPLGRRYAERVSGGAAILAGLVPPTHFTTLLLMLINFGLFAATLILSMKKSDSGNALLSVDPEVLLMFGAKWGPLSDQKWRLITAGFLHGGLFHILMNSWALYDLGAQAEQTYGTARFLVLYLASSAAGFWASTWWSPRALSIGASAAIFGLIGAMIAHYTKNRGWLGAEMKAIYVRWAIYGLLFGLLPMFNVDNAAHIGGLAAGFGLGYVAGEPGPRPIEWLWRAAAGFAVLIALASFGFVWLMYPRLS